MSIGVGSVIDDQSERLGYEICPTFSWHKSIIKDHQARRNGERNVFTELASCVYVTNLDEFTNILISYINIRSDFHSSDC